MAPSSYFLSQLTAYFNNKTQKKFNWLRFLNFKGKSSITLDGFSQVITFAFLINNVLVYLSSGQIVILGEADVKETLIVTQVKVNFSTIIQYKNLTCSKQWKCLG